jgi:CRP/FNR family transcriptional regulator
VVEEAVEAVAFPGDVLRRWVEVSPAVREFVFGLFTSRLAHVMTLLEEIVFRRVDDRLTEFLGDQFREAGGSQPVLRITHEAIAAELGTAREVVSRLLKELERRGAIRLSRGRIALRDPAVLGH